MGYSNLSIDELRVLEPCIDDVLTDARALAEKRLFPVRGPSPGYWRAYVYCPWGNPNLKDRVAQLVGWFSGHPFGSVLGSMEAYHVLTDAVLSELGQKAEARASTN